MSDDCRQVTMAGDTYQRKAPKTIAATPQLQKVPWPTHQLSPHREATATKAANQKTMVTNSTPAIAYLWAAAGKRAGARTRYATARRVQMEANSMKATLPGTQLTYASTTATWSAKAWNMGVEHHIRYAVRPRTMILKRTWAPRRPMTTAGGSILAVSRGGGWVHGFSGSIRRR